ncbi:MAG: helix-turn-helix domain-containing protein [Lachnospiraceae bacterium]|nr:helix-turn-helix domain-containing protein [Lachnospiraceae bacterium]
MNLGNNLRFLRKNHNLTQEELAEALGLSPQTISKWENDITSPDISLLPLLAEYYKISIDELLQYDSASRKTELKALAGKVHALEHSGELEKAYNLLHGEIEKWALSAGMNHLLGSLAYQLANEKTDRNELLHEAIRQADKTILLDQYETGRSIQAKMLQCYCLHELGRQKEAIKLANTLPSLFSSREVVLCRICDGVEREEAVRQANGYLKELLEELN